MQGAIELILSNHGCCIAHRTICLLGSFVFRSSSYGSTLASTDGTLALTAIDSRTQCSHPVALKKSRLAIAQLSFESTRIWSTYLGLPQFPQNFAVSFSNLVPHWRQNAARLPDDAGPETDADGVPNPPPPRPPPDDLLSSPLD